MRMRNNGKRTRPWVFTWLSRSVFGVWRRAVAEIRCNVGIGNFSHSRWHSGSPWWSIHLHFSRTRCVLHALSHFSLLKIPGLTQIHWNGMNEWCRRSQHLFTFQYHWRLAFQWAHQNVFGSDCWIFSVWQRVGPLFFPCFPTLNADTHQGRPNSCDNSFV